ncbi:MAG: hypothetical protein U5N53_28370 [Mycobacterium sp.]|nr:hypothetical protein [Mycobacterium sp.]
MSPSSLCRTANTSRGLRTPGDAAKVIPAAARYECPVCRRELKPTRGGNIPAHYDSIRAGTCPAEGEPFRIMLERHPMFTGVAS